MIKNNIFLKTSLLLLFVLFSKSAQSDEIERRLINAKATPEAISLYDYLRDNYGKKTLSAAMCKYTIESTEADWIHKKTGKYPAILCYDMMDATKADSRSHYSRMINSAKRWVKKGGIVSVMWHWRDPLKESDSFYSMNMNTTRTRTDFDVSKVHDPESREFKAMVEDIDIVASYLLQLQELNIPILWRPIHESQGGWFWWGAGNADDNKALWDLIYDRMVNHHKLNNLIWIWTVDRRDGRGKAEDWYPGDTKVDMLGIDIYDDPTHESKRAHFDFTAAIGSNRKMVALSECGTIPHPDNMMNGGDTWSWFMPWVGKFLHDEEFLTVETLKEIMQSDFVITRDEVDFTSKLSD